MTYLATNRLLFEIAYEFARFKRFPKCLYLLAIYAGEQPRGVRRWHVRDGVVGHNCLINTCLLYAPTPAERVDFIGNQVLDPEGGSGGAMSVRGNNWELSYRGGTLANNRAEFGGGMFETSSTGTTLTLDDLVFAGNVANRNGGAPRSCELGLYMPVSTRVVLILCLCRA